ncbi:MAG: histidine phosphatase family protein [Pseudomonadota bacterium]
MALTLILMRHAKSSWADPGQDDFDRPLNARGRRSAPAIAHWLVQNGHLPDVVLVSGARRTVETWERMATRMPETAEMKSAPAMYLADPSLVLNVLKSQTAPTIMMIGHNPGFALLSGQLVEAAPDHPKFKDYPTAATTVMEFTAMSWNEIELGTGRIVGFTVPKDLAT